MKLLFDENLSPRLVDQLKAEFPDSKHVRHAGLERALDDLVWSYARENGFVVVSKDADFHQLSFLFGHPPKVIWIRRGNSSTAEIAALLRDRSRNSIETEMGRFWRCVSRTGACEVTGKGKWFSSKGSAFYGLRHFSQ